MTSGYEGTVLPLVGTCFEEVPSFGSAANLSEVFGCRIGCDDVDWSDSVLSAEPCVVERRLCKLKLIRSAPTAASEESCL